MKLGQTQIFVWKFLVPSETVLLRQRGSDKRIFAIKPKLPLYDHNEAEISNVSPSWAFRHSTGRIFASTQSGDDEVTIMSAAVAENQRRLLK